MSNKSATIKEQPNNNVPSIKVLPAQIARLKKEEDEESWISGEELNTEGSSDEENSKSCKPSLPNPLNKESKLAAGKLFAKNKVDKKTKSLDIQSTSQKEPTHRGSVSDEEEYPADDEISWKVNRGSGNLTKDPLSS